MGKNTKDQIQRRMKIRKIIVFVRDSKWMFAIIAIIGYFLLAKLHLSNERALVSVFGSEDANITWIDSLLSKTMFVYVGVMIVLYIILIKYPFELDEVEDKLYTINLHNHLGDVPKLIRVYSDSGNERITIWEFKSKSIPLVDWEERREEIEAALNITIVKMKYSEGKDLIILHTVSAITDLPEKVVWKDQYLPKTQDVLVLGESYTGRVEVDLSKIPHILLGGSTGSGKSVLLKLLLMQSVKNEAWVYIADFKGGVDFSRWWHEECDMCITEDELWYVLTNLIAQLELRKKILTEAGCSNINEYYKKTGERLRRIILACDEVAEILDKTGADAERKKKLNQIENKLSTIARQGRAFGIHLILATQRPDANIIPGQIRNNLDCRICGRADNILSQIILDSTAAADQIPKDATGRFMMHDGTVFQAYWFDEEL